MDGLQANFGDQIDFLHIDTDDSEQRQFGRQIEPGGEGAKYVARMIPLSIIDAKFLNLGGSLPSLTEVLH